MTRYWTFSNKTIYRRSQFLVKVQINRIWGHNLCCIKIIQNVVTGIACYWFISPLTPFALKFNNKFNTTYVHVWDDRKNAVQMILESFSSDKTKILKIKLAYNFVFYWKMFHSWNLSRSLVSHPKTSGPPATTSNLVLRIDFTAFKTGIAA